MPSSPPPDLCARLKIHLWRVNKAMERVEIQSLKTRGLQLTDFGILEALLHKGPLPINILGQKVLLTSGSITTAVHRLQDRGLLERYRDGADGRVTLVRLTPHGEALIRTEYAAHLECLAKLGGALSEAEILQLLPLLKKLGKHAEALQTEA